MIRLHGIVGQETDPDLAPQLHALQHRGLVERLFVPETELGRRRFRLMTDEGTECGVSVGRDEVLADGSVLLLTEQRAIVVRIGAPRTWRLHARTPEAALQLGWTAGHLHWRVKFDGPDLLVLLDGPVADYSARVQRLISQGDVGEIGV